MTKSAIQFAFYLHAHPDSGLEQWKLMRALPQGMSELLQVTASHKKRKALADQYAIEDDYVVQEVLHKFLHLVLSDHLISPYRGLAAREQASLETCRKHKKLLQSIFHPDRFPNDYSHEIMQQVQQSFDKISTMQRVTDHSQPNNTINDLSEKEADHISSLDFSINHSPKYSKRHIHSQKKKQINYVLVAGIAGIALLGILIMIMVPSNPQSIVRQPTITLAKQTDTIEKQFSLVSNISRPLPTTKKLTLSTTFNQMSDIQDLLNDFEAALEENLIAEVNGSQLSPQSSKQIIDLFLSATNKKVFLHDFSWQSVGNGFYGEGKFLTRFEFNDRKQWITRRGKSAITLSNEDSKLLIKQFHFEDNLH